MEEREGKAYAWRWYGFCGYLGLEKVYVAILDPWCCGWLEEVVVLLVCVCCRGCEVLQGVVAVGCVVP